MKFLCLECDHVMSFAERQIPGDGTLAAVFSCDSCGREMAMLTNPMETQLVSGMGVKIGGRTVPEQPMEITRSTLEEGREDVFVPSDEEPGQAADEKTDVRVRPTESRESGEADAGGGASTPDGLGGPGGGRPGKGRVEWTPDAVDRLQRVPRFVRGMVKRIYTDYARERGIREMTPETMDRARSDLGLEGM